MAENPTPSPEAETPGSPAADADPPRYVLPSNLDAAIKHLDDEQLDRLATAVLEERTRRKGPPVVKSDAFNANDDPSKTNTDGSSLPIGKLNAVRAAFKAGVTPARIAREFGLSKTDVQKALARNFAK